jgi:arabinogalactan endo-1,4-beta-galactosidase
MIKNYTPVQFLTYVVLSLIFVLLTSYESNSQEYQIGADLSFLKDAEDAGCIFKDNGETKTGLLIFADHGYNWIRLRIFHTPTELPNNLDYTLALALDAKKLGYKFLLDFHYSDTWADPGKQFIPEAWRDMSHEELVMAVYEYTRETISAFGKAGVMPDMVQNGNEIINGMLWPDGKIPENWDNFAELVQAGTKGVRDGCGDLPCPEIMVQIDQGGNKERTKYFFDKLISYGIEFDYIGQSYYPWWHGTLLDLRENMYFMAKTYKKPIILVEVAYCSEPTEYIDKPAPFPETPEGQKEFLEEVNRIVMETPDNLGRGIFWWEPAVSNKRGIATRDLFDEQGNALPAVYVFDKFTRH